MSEQTNTPLEEQDDAVWPSDRDEIESDEDLADEKSGYGGAGAGPDGPDEQDEDQGI